MSDVFLLLGSNEGDRILWFRKALTELSEHCGKIVAKSAIYESDAWGLTEQPDFLNMVIRFDTTLAPGQLLECIHATEDKLGRQRHVKWGQRTLDIDILLYDNIIMNTPDLDIPHPYLHLRRFTLAPLAEIAPSLIHPVSGKTIAELLSICPDELEVRKTDYRL